LRNSEDGKTIYVSSTEVHLTRGWLFDEVAVKGKKVIVTRYERPYVQITRIDEEVERPQKKIVNG